MRTEPVAAWDGAEASAAIAAATKTKPNANVRTDLNTSAPQQDQPLMRTEAIYTDQTASTYWTEVPRALFILSL